MVLPQIFLKKVAVASRLGKQCVLQQHYYLHISSQHRSISVLVVKKEIVSNKYNGSGRVYRHELSIIVSVSGRCKVG